MSTGICYIFGAGERSGGGISLAPDDLVIAADGGFDYLEELGLRADRSEEHTSELQSQR